MFTSARTRYSRRCIFTRGGGGVVYIVVWVMQAYCLQYMTDGWADINNDGVHIN